MGKAETIVVGTLLAASCALLGFVICWWTAALVHLHLVAISVNVIIIAAVSGLLAGIVLDIVFLRRWIHGFYTARPWCMAAVYTALCVVAVASFMGVPIGTFGLGLLAGIYAGRRQHHNAVQGSAANCGLKKTALFAATLTASAAVPIGLLAVRDQSVADSLHQILGMEPRVWRSAVGVIIVSALSLVLFAAQYGCSLQVGRLALRLGPRVSESSTPVQKSRNQIIH